ncbi:hypothetical protein GUITHDRAFT_149721 [Guillardia theta CCMP2712]|uniref:N-acetyltransferase domain-containing protein n=1 Tax=Guillardia theta (strain CCMP2712) TaxID=905079 RepID=L1K3L3_GUITC|nr:hypothetical protein GUITHDRAFT_149721 [Guillardia theta CCMP2712]EKX55172.1 hypothetical protein GUITHDRAFT_149721 [Guillardia theta CCMP2712]|eukprot:XP_005842152.1 hypothetical protein GUITHDRAFT_149721 [Guillardia theta CCMP2712]
MAVREEFRRRGCGQLLLEGCEGIARRNYGVSEIYLHVEEENAGALKMYKQSGFTSSDMRNPTINRMDRLLRLVLRVPKAATLYSRRIFKDLLEEEDVEFQLAEAMLP